mgnify:CR=1 FL=1|tara:strand:+ start:849 stop:1346 length:498 start_codon:yes stop_codon:yes gene_type:complete
MFQGIYKALATGGEYTWKVSTEDRRIDTSVTTAHIQYLVKFTNDMDKRVVYAYPTKLGIYDRYTTMTFVHNTTEDFLTSEINFIPNGYWYYEVYEVSWIGVLSLTSATAPANEDDVLLPIANTKGVVQGLVEQGKLYIAEPSGEEQVQYNQHPEPAGTNYIYYGQ